MLWFGRNRDEQKQERIAGHTVEVYNNGQPTFTDTNYLSTVRQAFKGNETVFSGITAINRSFLEATLQVQKQDGTPIPNHPLSLLFQRPNPFMTDFAFWERALLQYYMAGNIFIHKVRSRAGGLVELWPLRPDRVWVVPDIHGYITGYRYKPYQWDIPVAFEDICHIKFEDPSDEYFGMSPLKAAFRQIDVDNEATNHTKSTLENGATPGLAVLVDHISDEAHYSRLQAGWRKKFGRGNFGKVGFFDKVKDIKTVGMDFEKLAWKDLRGVSEARILGALGVPPIIAGALIGLENATYANAQQFRTLFWENTISPLQRRFASALEISFQRELGGNKIGWNCDNVTALRAMKQEQLDGMLKALAGGACTLNEYRVQLGLKPDPQGDIYFRPNNVTAVPFNTPVDALPVPVVTSDPSNPPPNADPPAPKPDEGKSDPPEGGRQ